MASLSRIKILRANYHDSVEKYFAIKDELDLMMKERSPRMNDIKESIASLELQRQHNQDLDQLITINIDLYTKQELKLTHGHDKIYS